MLFEMSFPISLAYIIFHVLLNIQSARINYRCETSFALSLVPFSLSFIIAVPSNPKIKWVTIGIIKTKILRMHPISMFREVLSELFPLNAPPHGRPTHGSYNKADVNKEPKFNLCSGESPHLHRLWFMSVICIPVRCPDGPTNLSCSPPPSLSRPSPP